MASNKENRIIVDTNLWISWLISKEYKKLDKILVNKNSKIVFSQELLEEFIDVSNRPKLKKYFSKSDVESLLNVIDENVLFIEVNSKIELCRDVKDNFLLSLAADAKATHLITGDKDLLDLKKFKTTVIITMTDFLK